MIRQLIDFKLMLCEIGRGNRHGFGALAETNLRDKGTPLAEYTKVVAAMQAGDPVAAGEAFDAVGELFPDEGIRAPWNDTLMEFGYMNVPEE